MVRVEQKTIRRAQRGDLRSFDALVSQCYAMVYNIAYRLLGDAERASDATQEAFVRAFTGLPRFRLDSSFTTWLYRITTNVCLDELRRRQRGPAEESLAPDDEDEARPPVDPPNGSPGPDRQTETAERQELVHSALQRLSEDHRAIIVLFDLQGLSYDEVSAVLGVPLGTVKSRLNRARLSLKEQLAPHRELFET
jgi:RNA polymerase sigma-70 factor (ECF subfamily)